MYRRTALALGGVTLAGVLAGCVGDDAADSPATPTDNTTDRDDAADGSTSSDDTDSTDDGTVDANPLAARLQTSLGPIDIELYAGRAPRTVDNFVGLATGEQAWVAPESGAVVDGDPLYDDVLFHRVIDGFMIQTGDPTGTGRGGPGYQFDDEFHEELRHDRPGMLSMANSGADTNGSQFFITLSPTPHLDGRHSVFGRVTDGMDVVDAIGAVDTDENDRPTEPVLLESVTIENE